MRRWIRTACAVSGIGLLAALALIGTLAASSALAAPAERQSAEPPAGEPQPLLTSTASLTVYLPQVVRYSPNVLYDDFSDPSSGWPDDASSICNPHTNEPITKAGKPWIVVQWTRGYNNGEYQFFIPPANATAVWFCQPDALAPWIVATDVYTVETLVRYAEGEYDHWDLNPWWDNAGLIFGANEANTQLFMICLGTQTYDDGSRTIRWNVHANTPYPYKYWDVPDKPYNFPYRGCSEDWLRVIDPWRTLGIHNNGYNHLMAAVNGDTVKVYINGQYGGQYTLPGLAAATRVGLIGGPYEYTPSDIRFDWIRVTLQY